MAVLEFCHRAELLPTVTGNSTFSNEPSQFATTITQMRSQLRIAGTGVGGWSVTPRSAFWFHMCHSGRNDNDVEFFASFLGNGVELFRLATTAGGDWQVQYHNDSTWVQVGSNITSPTQATAKQIDIEFNIADTGGVYEVYADGVSVASLGGGDTLFRGETQIDEIRLANTTNSSVSDSIFAEVLIADEDTTKFKCSETIVDSDGFYTGWTNGDFTAINETIDQSDTSNLLQVDVADTRASFNMEDEPVEFDTNHDVITVLQYIRGRHSSIRSGGIAPFVRISSTNYDQTDIDFVENDWPFILQQYDNDPSTSLPWANAAAVEAAEFGFISRGAPVGELEVGQMGLVTVYKRPPLEIAQMGIITIYKRPPIEIAHMGTVTVYKLP